MTRLFPRISALLAAALVLAPLVVSAQTVLRYSDHEPLGGMRTRFIKDVLFPAIERESNGRLKIDDQWDGKRAISYEALKAVREGKVADMAIVVPEYTPNELPLHQIFKGFPLGPTGDRQVAFFRRVYAEIPAFAEELKRNNLVDVFYATGYPVAYFSTAPLASLEAIKGQTWRSASFWHFAFLRSAGAVPVTMPWGEGVYKAMADRTLDGLMVNVDSGVMLNVHKAAPHVLLSKDLWLGHLYTLAMNKDVWDGLAGEDKAAIRRAADQAYKTLGSVMDTSFEEIVANMKKEGVQVRQLSRDELAAWNAAAKYQDAQTAWVKEQEGKGHAAAGPTLERVRALLDASIR